MLLKSTKEEKDLYILNALSNLAQDEAAHNITNRKNITGWHELFGVMMEEVEETKEAFNNLEAMFLRLWGLIREDADQEEKMQMLNNVRFEALNVMQEGLHVRAVAIKGLEQLQNKGE